MTHVLDLTDPTPWTWEQIAALNEARLEAFLAAYGDRGMAAAMAAGHKEGTWKECVLIGLGKRRYCLCTGCPLSRRSSWRTKRSWGVVCSEVAMTVYRRMIRKLGLLPEAKRGQP